MFNKEIRESVTAVREYFSSNTTKDPEFRIGVLSRLRLQIIEHESLIMDALKTDLNKSSFESYSTEIGLVLKEIDLNIRHIRRWSRSESILTPFLFWPSKSRIHKEPYGVVLIIAPWNYPFNLLFLPLISAIGAGNCVVLKSSPYVPSVNKVMESIITKSFENGHVSFHNGNREVNKQLLDEKFDYIFFTGSPSLGKIVMQAASKNLTPVTLELGGKSPCIIDEDTDPAVAARRIVWGKTINAGQTCIAPDYLMVHENIKEQFVAEVEKAIRMMYGSDPGESPDYPRIINEKAMDRLIGYLREGNLVLGGKYNKAERYFEPTIITDIAPDSPLMNEEIFGPIFPLIPFRKIEEVINYINEKERPLALYYFTENKKKSQMMLEETSSGGVCINDTIIHIANHRLPFGGVGNSGIGQYHGKYGFDTFTHKKPVVTSSISIDIKIKYPPYKGKLEKFKRVLR